MVVARIEVETVVQARPEAVWAALADIGSHVEWMADAERIDFTSGQRSGLGTTFDCITRVGPIRLTDRMEIVEWEAERSIGVVHTGVVTGRGRFTMAPVAPDAVRLAWAEELRFPWWLGGPVGAVPGRRILARLWRGNLRRLKQRLEAGIPA